MAIFLSFFFIFFSSAAACDRCLHQSNATYFSSSALLSSGSCGYGSLALGFYGGHSAAAVASVYRDGIGCGGCFHIRCKNQTLCSKKGTKVIVTDLNKNNKTDFVLSKKAFVAMASKGMEKHILKHGDIPVEYKRIPCEYKNQNLSARVEETSQKPHYLAIKFLYQGGQTDILLVEVAQVGSSIWNGMSRSYGAVWNTSDVPAGELQLRLVVTGGYDAKWVFPSKTLPADWKVGAIYDLGVQISDVAQQGCGTCDAEERK